MTTFIAIVVSLVIGAVGGFIGGILVGRKNASKVNTIVDTTNKVAADIKTGGK